MGKFEEHYELCEQLYVNKGYTLSRVKNETGVSLTTLTKWKDAGDWEKRRKQYLQTNRSLKALLEEIKLKLAKGVLDKLEKNEIDTQAVYALSSLLRNTKQDKPGDSPGSPDDVKNVSKEELMKMLREQVYGLA
jgi:transposase-like protein